MHSGLWNLRNPSSHAIILCILSSSCYSVIALPMHASTLYRVYASMHELIARFSSWVYYRPHPSRFWFQNYKFLSAFHQSYCFIIMISPFYTWLWEWGDPWLATYASSFIMTPLSPISLMSVLPVPLTRIDVHHSRNNWYFILPHRWFHLGFHCALTACASLVSEGTWCWSSMMHAARDRKIESEHSHVLI